MNLSISGLLGEVEGSAGRLTRQVVENATDPIKAAGLEMVDAALRPASSIGLGLILKLVFGLLSLVLVIAAIGFGSASLYDYVAGLEGKPIAGLVVGGVYLVLAAISAFAMIKVSLMPPVPAKHVTQPSVSSAAVEDRARTDALARTSSRVQAEQAELNVKMAVSPPPANSISFPDAEDLVAALGAAGFEREQAGLQAGLALARRLSPVQLALVGAAAGFIGGRRMRSIW